MIAILLQKIYSLLSTYFTSIKTKLNYLYENIDAGGDDIQKLIDRTITSVTISGNVGNQAFNSCTLLTDVTFSNQSESIGINAFNMCYALESINLKNITEIGAYAFKSCSHLHDVIANELLTAGNQAFSGCALNGDISFNKLTTIGDSCFSSGGLTGNIVFNELTTMGLYAFQNNGLLTSFRADKLTEIGRDGFANCGSLDTLIFGGNSVVGGYNQDIVRGTKFGANKTGGTLYVPRALITAYQNDSLWSTILALNTNNQILAIEDM